MSLQKCIWIAFVGSILFAASDSLFAQEAAAVATAAGKNYILAYSLVFLVMVLGGFCACRPVKRADRPKSIELEIEKKIRMMAGKDG